MEKRTLRIMGHEIRVVVSELIPQDLILFVSPSKARDIEDFFQIGERVMKYLKAAAELKGEK